MASLTGKLLVASPDLLDPNFARSVVLMIQHDDDGGVGLVLNRSSQARLKAIWEQLCDEPCPIELRVMHGGPVEGPLVALHTEPALAEREIVSGVYLAARKDLVIGLVAAHAAPLRIYVGYAGWASGQLEAEIQEGSWGVADATSSLVFGDDGEALWQQLTRSAADRELIERLRITHVPEQPWHN
jgi:putative transcriptional regulator